MSTTPLPKSKVFVACTIMFLNSFMASVLMPFLSFMISDFNIAPSVEDIGEYSGYLVSSFMLGQLLFSIFWGAVSDRYGRRPVLLFGLLSTSITFLAFGFSTTFGMAVALRALTGAVNGVVGVCKTYMSEITDSTNQAKGFSVFGVARGMGMIFGPIVGGFLCMPAKKYPYALPCVIGSVLTIIGFVVACFVLEESNVHVLASQNHCLVVTDEEQPLLGNVNAANDTVVQIQQKQTFCELLRRPKVFYTILFYTTVSFIYIQFDELFALWSRLPIIEGGLEFDSSDQGSAYFIGGLALFIYQIFFFTPIERKLGTLSTFRVGLLLSFPAFILLPLVGDFDEIGIPKWLVWTGVGIAQILRQAFGVQAFTSVFIMISNATDSASRGSINGIAQTLGSLGRMLGPVFAGSLFSWSLYINRFPIDFHFVFWICAIILASLFLASFKLDESINHRESDVIDSNESIP